MKKLKSRQLSNLQFFLFLLVAIALTVLFAVLVLFTMGTGWAATALWLSFGLAIILVIAGIIASRNIFFFLQRLYGLSEEEAKQLRDNLVFGVSTLPPVGPVLLVSEGRADPDGPGVLKKAGGPGYLVVRPDSAAVTCRGGELHRVLGPGFYDLEPFERVWDTVDLRRQRRTDTVEAVTRDGIPVTAEIELFFQVSHAGQRADELRHYPYDPEIILRLTTMKRFLGEQAKPSVKRWPELVLGNAKGTVRNKLESMRLEEILNLQSDEAPLAALSRELEQVVREAVAVWGVSLESLRIGPIQPQDEGVSRRWMQRWRAQWERAIRRWNAEARTQSWQTIEAARIQAGVDLLTRMFENWGTIENEISDEESRETLAMMLQIRFMEVLRSMSREDPLVQMTMLEEIGMLRETLIIGETQGGSTDEAKEFPAPPSET